MSIGYEVTIFWLSVSIDIFTILERLVFIIKGNLRDFSHEWGTLLIEAHLPVNILSIREKIFCAIPPLRLIPYSRLGCRWKCAYYFFSGKVRFPFMQEKIILKLRSSPQSFFRTKCRKWNRKSLSSNYRRNLLQKRYFLVWNSELFSRDATCTSDRHN